MAVSLTTPDIGVQILADVDVTCHDAGDKCRGSAASYWEDWQEQHFCETDTPLHSCVPRVHPCFFVDHASAHSFDDALQVVKVHIAY